MKKILLFLLSLFLTTSIAMAQKKDYYKKAWKEVKAHQSNRKYKSALKVLDEIYAYAKKKNHKVQLIKALVEKGHLYEYRGEEELDRRIVFDNYLSEIKSTKEPDVKAVLHSVLGVLYFNAYSNLRYATNTQTDDPKDPKTWAKERFLRHAQKHCAQSLEDKSIINIPIATYDLLMLRKGEKDARILRPTLYDVLADRAIHFFTDNDVDITQPKYNFVIEDPKYLADINIFVQQKINTKDTLSFDYQALKIYQELLKVHLNDKDPAALIYANVQRLKYIHSRLDIENKDQLTIEQLQKVIKNNSNQATISHAYALIATIYQNQGYQNTLKDQPYKWSYKKAIEVCQKAQSLFPKAIGTKYCRGIESQILHKKITKLEMQHDIVPKTPFLVSLTYKNISKLDWKIVKVNFEDFKKHKYKHDELGKKLIKSGRNIIKQGSFDLKDEGDHNSYITELNMPKVDKGFYLLVFTVNEGKKEIIRTFDFFQVTNLFYTAKNKYDNLGKGQTFFKRDFYVLYRDTGLPVENAKVVVKDRWDTHTYKTDKNGHLEIAVDLEYTLTITKGDDFIYDDKNERNYTYPNGNQVNVAILTDRVIYRPGQTIFYKGIMTEGVRNQIKLQKGKKLKVKLYTPNNQIFATKEVVTNEFGSFEGTFIAPAGLTGQCHLKCDYASKYISIEEYKRPKFEVKIDTLEGTPKLREKVTVTGQAIAYSGASIGGAKISYKVYREARFPRWYYWRGPTSPSQKIIDGTATTDKAGKFSIDFEAIPDANVPKDADPIFTYIVLVDVTDINGETHTKESRINIGYKSLEVSLTMPKVLDRSTKGKYEISTKNLMGKFVTSQGDIKLYRLPQSSSNFIHKRWDFPTKHIIDESNYRKLFPHAMYSPKDDPSYQPDLSSLSLVKSYPFDTSKEKTFDPDFSSMPVGQYLLIITSKDQQGKLVKDQSVFTLFDHKSKKVPTNEALWLTAVKKTCEPGEKAEFVIGNKDAGHIYYEVVTYNGDVIQKKWLKANDKQKQIIVPIIEAYRGNIFLNVFKMKHNSFEKRTEIIEVPFTNKELDITFNTFRDKLKPGQKEAWSLTIKGKKGEKVLAEMVTTLYDASLDVFRKNDFKMDLYKSNNLYHTWKEKYDINHFHYSSNSVNTFYFFLQPDVLFSPVLSRHQLFSRSHDRKLKKKSVDKAVNAVNADVEEMEHGANQAPPKAPQPEPDGDVQIRKNFNETAFFYPNLYTNEAGEIVIKFTIPEALTRWKMLGLAHTKDLKVGTISKELVTQKELMVVPNQPRFFREGDKMRFSTKVVSLIDKALSGKVELLLFDALTMQPVDKLLKNKKTKKTFSVGPNASTVVHWDIEIPAGLQALTYRVVAKSGAFSDGEEMALPVVTNRMLVTESLPLPIRGKQSKTFTLEKLSKPLSKTAKHQRFTLEFTSNPAWYAVQALPYMMEYPYECAEQTFSRYYANAIAGHIIEKHPKVKRIFDTWKNLQPDAMLSKLEKNQELKAILLEETPWVLNAKSETERKRNIGLLMDINRTSQQQVLILQKLEKMQKSDGGFPWFEGMRSNRYITQHILELVAHLKAMDIDISRFYFLERAMQYVDQEMQKDYLETKAYCLKNKKKLSEQRTATIGVHYLYVRSLLKKEHPLNKKYEEAYNFHLAQSKKYWAKYNSTYLEGMIALALHAQDSDETATTKDIIESLKERSKNSEEMGMYWPKNQAYYWHQAPIETQALLIEVFDVVGKDKESVEAMKVWLLKQKQTQDWKTTKATAAACYALLSRGTDLLASDKLVEITVGDQKINAQTRPDIKVEAGTGYLKTAWTAKEITSNMATIKVTKKDEGVAWGAAYWQYFEQLDKITPAKTPLSINKQVYIQKETDKGPLLTSITEKNTIHLGDLIKVRIEITVDRDMEYVHLKDMRASAFEPLNTISQSKYQNGLYYYESTRDLSTSFFIGYLPKGTYVFEYPLRASQVGNFSNGVTTIQSMYAPEFSSHSEGIRVKVVE